LNSGKNIQIVHKLRTGGDHASACVWRSGERRAEQQACGGGGGAVNKGERMMTEGKVPKSASSTDRHGLAFARGCSNWGFGDADLL